MFFNQGCFEASVTELEHPESPRLRAEGQGGDLRALLGGSWDLVSTVISTLSGVISNYKYSYLNYNPSY